MFVEPGKMGYYNFPPHDGPYEGIKAYFYPDGQGVLAVYEWDDELGEELLEEHLFEYPVGKWFTCTHEKSDSWGSDRYVTVSINGDEIHTWGDISFIGHVFGEGIEFYGLPDAGAGYYLDDIRFTRADYLLD